MSYLFPVQTSRAVSCHVHRDGSSRLPVVQADARQVPTGGLLCPRMATEAGLFGGLSRFRCPGRSRPQTVHGPAAQRNPLVPGGSPPLAGNAHEVIYF